MVVVEKSRRSEHKLLIIVLKFIPMLQACQKLNVSRATFGNLVREGVIPRGEKVVGFKELFWEEKTLDEVIKSRRNGNKENN